MGRLKKSVTFWIILAVSVVMPSLANAQRTVTKKTGWSAAISDAGGARVGTATITRTVNCTFSGSNCIVTSIEWRYKLSTVAYGCTDQPCLPGQIVATKASIVGPSWSRVLCEDDTCAYKAESDGDLDLSGPFPSPLPSLGDELDRGDVTAQINDGALGVGTFVKTNNQVVVG